MPRIGRFGMIASLGALSIATFFLPRSSVAAGIDCAKASTFVERGICADPQLRTLDDQLNAAYGRAFRAAPEPLALQQEQRNWLRTARDACTNTDCLRSAYETRIRVLTRRYDVYSQTKDSRASAVPRCVFGDLVLPADFAVLAGGAYSGRKLDVQIDQSGHEATAMDVYVHFTAKPVVLMLGAYEPTIWNIRWSRQTRILAVLVGGYHRQGVAGLPRTLPLQVRSNEDRSACGYFYVSTDNLKDLNPLSRTLFGRAVDLFYPAEQGRLVVGTPAPATVDYVNSPDTSPDSFVDRNAPPAGTAGLQDAAAHGLIRPATVRDADDWVRAVAASRGPADEPPVAGQPGPRVQRPGLYRAYVVLKPFRYPAGLYGGNLATFFIPRGVPAPTGNPGHSSIYDFNTLSCQGVICESQQDRAVPAPAPRAESAPAPASAPSASAPSASAAPPYSRRPLEIRNESSTPDTAYQLKSASARRSGRWYFEVTVDLRKVVGQLEASLSIGIARPSDSSSTGTVHNIRPTNVTVRAPDGGGVTIVGVRSDDPVDSKTVIGVAADLDAGKVYIRRDTTWERGNAPGSVSGLNIAQKGADYRAAVFSSVGIQNLIEQGVLDVNFGSKPFVDAMPEGYQTFDSRLAGVATGASAFLPPFSRVADQSIEHWIQSYWTWTRGFPESLRPHLDTNGERCADGQSGPVWFLTGSDGTRAVQRRCTVPAGVHLLVPMVNTLAAGDWTTKCEDLLWKLADGRSIGDNLRLSVDGVRLEQPEAYYASAGCFELVNSSRGGGPYPASATGYWAMLLPLPRGRHEIRFGGRIIRDGFTQDITYLIDVK